MYMHMKCTHELYCLEVQTSLVRPDGLPSSSHFNNFYVQQATSICNYLLYMLMKVIFVCNLSNVWKSQNEFDILVAVSNLTSFKRFSTYPSIHSIDALFLLGKTVTSCGNGWSETAQKYTACIKYCSLQILYSVTCHKTCLRKLNLKIQQIIVVLCCCVCMVHCVLLFYIFFGVLYEICFPLSCC